MSRRRRRGGRHDWRLTTKATLEGRDPIAASVQQERRGGEPPRRRIEQADYGFVTFTFGTATFALSFRMSTLGTLTVVVSLTMSTSGVLMVLVSVFTSTSGVWTW